MIPFSRRAFLLGSSVLSGSLVVGQALTGCVSAGGGRLSQANFTHGVASGDPLTDRVIIWTRAVPADLALEARIGWQMAEDAEFKRIVAEGQAQAKVSYDYTLKVDVTGLSAGKRYYYRFLSASASSDIGQTITLPETADSLRMAVFSCSNYPAGHFNVYQLASENPDIDLVLHLGDYIYEYGMGGYATQKAATIGRALPADNANELLSLTDYRKRYATYRTDKGLLALHQARPFIAVWDDHEIANDTWKNGAENHNEGEGDFLARKMAAIQAYYEWMPIRPPMGDTHQQIYRQFDYGNLVSLYMLDTRVIARDEQLDYKGYFAKDSGKFDQAAFARDLMAPQRALMGETQLNWLVEAMATSDCRWQVLGQQILMGKMLFPAEIIAAGDFKKVPAMISELVALKQKVLQGEQLPVEQLARLQQKLAYNLDAWDGYPAEREKLYQAVKQLNKKLVVLAGDTHNAWYNKLVAADGSELGIELGVSSVSSPGMETYLSMTHEQAAQLAQGLTLLIDDLQYCDMSHRGYLHVQFDQSQITSNWCFVDQIDSTEFTALTPVTKVWTDTV